jgi:hypothetical protein
MENVAKNLFNAAGAKVSYETKVHLYCVVKQPGRFYNKHFT